MWEFVERKSAAVVLRDNLFSFDDFVENGTSIIFPKKTDRYLSISLFIKLKKLLI